MKQDETTTLGNYLREAREAKQLSTRELSRRTDVIQSAIVKIEVGRLKRPRADMLATLAAELDLPLGDVYALAEYTIPDQPPSFARYLRARYGSLPSRSNGGIGRGVRTHRREIRIRQRRTRTGGKDER